MKKLLMIIPLFIFIFLVNITESNARVICSRTDLSNLKSKAYSTTISYEFHKDLENGHYFNVIITNLPEGIYAKVDGVTIGLGTKKEKYIIPKYNVNGYEVVVDLYAETGQACGGEKLYTKRVPLPKYNYYSEREECIEYEEFPLCSPWYTGKIESEYYFEQKYYEYLDKINKKEEKEEKEENKSVIEKIIDFYVEHLIITVPITIVVVGGTGVIVARRIVRRKKRVKIDY